MMEAAICISRSSTVPRRKSVNIPGFRHINPIPNASRIGNLLVSGVIVGIDPTTGKVPADLEQPW